MKLITKKFILSNPMIPLSDALGIGRSFVQKPPSKKICKVHRFPPGRYTRTCSVCGISEEKYLRGNWKPMKC